MSARPHALLRRLTRRAWLLLLPLAATLAATDASAVPAYARQTGQACTACHIGGFGPQLTPYGMRFKIGGYTDTDGGSGHVPVSAMAVGSVNRTEKDDGTGKVTKTDLSEASIFLSGKIAPHVGSYVQVTYDGIEHHTALDIADVRATMTKTIGGKDTVFGVTVNNAPTTQDPFNTLPNWSYPYTEAPRGAGPGGAEFTGLGGLEGTVLGTSVYALWNNHLYTELGTYRAMSPTLLDKIGVDAENSPGKLSGSAYWRVAWMGGSGRRSGWSAGVFGNQGTLKDRDTGETTSRFRDLGVDGSYQFLGTREHVFTVNSSFIRERDSVTDSTVRETKLNGSYYYKNTWGFSAGLYNANADGNINANRGYVLQTDWTPWGKEDSWNAPWANVRLGVQYYLFDRFYDENGERQKASRANTINFFVWTAF